MDSSKELALESPLILRALGQEVLLPFNTMVGRIMCPLLLAVRVLTVQPEQLTTPILQLQLLGQLQLLALLQLLLWHRVHFQSLPMGVRQRVHRRALLLGLLILYPL